jgi:hypothetical protein
MLRQRRLVVGLRMTNQQDRVIAFTVSPLVLEQLLGNEYGLLRIS